MPVRLLSLVLALALQATFRGGVEIVAVDFIAVTDDGRPVADLTPSELKLTVDGRVRDIRDLQFIRLATTPGVGVLDGPQATPTPGVLPFGTNRAGEIGRTVIFLFDDNSIAPGNERAAKDAAGRFLDRLSPNDRVALATAARVEVDLTTNHERVREALKNVSGHANTAIRQAGQTMVWLRVFLEGLKSIDGPKSVVFVSQGVPSAIKDPSIAADYKDIAKAAGAVSAHLYMVQPHNLPSGASQNSESLGMDSTSQKLDMSAAADYHKDVDDNLQGLEALSTVTGGELFRLSGSADPVFEHVLRQSSAYYLLGFAPESSERNGKSHRIAITVARRGVTIRARPDFTIPKATPAAAPGPTVVQMLKETKGYREIPLRAAAYSTRGAKGAVNVVVAAESIDGSIPLREVGFALIDTTSRRLVLPWAASASEISGRRVVSGGSVPPGSYRLRVAAISQDGRRGAVEYEFIAGVVRAQSVDLGDLMVGQGKADGTFEPALEFGERPVATGYLELYGALPIGTVVTATFELAQSQDAPALVSVPGIVARTATADQLAARGAIPIASVPAGDYVVRAVIKVNDAVAGRVLRTLRIVK